MAHVYKLLPLPQSSAFSFSPSLLLFLTHMPTPQGKSSLSCVFHSLLGLSPSPSPSLPLLRLSSTHTTRIRKGRSPTSAFLILFLPQYLPCSLFPSTIPPTHASYVGRSSITVFPTPFLSQYIEPFHLLRCTVWNYPIPKPNLISLSLTPCYAFATSYNMSHITIARFPSTHTYYIFVMLFSFLIEPTSMALGTNNVSFSLLDERIRSRSSSHGSLRGESSLGKSYAPSLVFCEVDPSTSPSPPRDRYNIS